MDKSITWPFSGSWITVSVTILNQVALFFPPFWLMFTLAVQQYKIVYEDNIILCA